jgi:hypothetical protein
MLALAGLAVPSQLPFSSGGLWKKPGRMCILTAMRALFSYLTARYGT